MLIIFTKGEATNYMESFDAATLLRSNRIKIITVYIGSPSSVGYTEQRNFVTDVGELAGLRVDRIDQLTNINTTYFLQRATDIPAPLRG